MKREKEEWPKAREGEKLIKICGKFYRYQYDDANNQLIYIGPYRDSSEPEPMEKSKDIHIHLHLGKVSLGDFL